MNFALAFQRWSDLANHIVCQDDNAPAFGSLVSKDANCAALASSSTCTLECRKKLSRLTVSKSDGSPFIEEQHIHIPVCFHRAAAHGQYFFLDLQIDSRNPMALSRPPIVVGIRQTSNAINTVIVNETPNKDQKASGS